MAARLRKPEFAEDRYFCTVESGGKEYLVLESDYALARERCLDSPHKLPMPKRVYRITGSTEKTFRAVPETSTSLIRRIMLKLETEHLDDKENVDDLLIMEGCTTLLAEAQMRRRPRSERYPLDCL